MTFPEYIEKELKERGYRFTHPRKVVAEVLGSGRSPLNAYDIERRILDTGEKVDIVTIYRILEVYKGLGLVHEVRNGYLACEYTDCHESKHCHHQFVCEKCDDVTEIHVDECGVMGQLAERASGVAIKSHYVELSGVCGSCLKV